MRRAALAAALAACAACAGDDAPRTVLVVSLDSVRADALTFRDPAASPRLAALAERGTVFTHAIAASSWTLPTHVAMFTGQPPVLHGVQHDATGIDPRTPTLPRLLADDGWTALGWYTGWYLAKDFGYPRGFTVYENALTGGEALERDFARLVGEGRHAAARELFGARDIASHRDVTSPTVVQRARAALDAAPRGGDLFLFAHLFDPHYDYVPPPPWDTRFDPDYRGAITGRDYFLNREIYDPDAEPKRRIGDRDLAHIVALYRGEIGWTDQHVGAILDLLDERGRLDDALVIVTADHGEEFFEHGGRGHRNSLYDEQLRIPLLVVDGRGGNAVRACDAQVTQSDYAPTVLDWAGLAAPPTMTGRSLLPAIAGREFASLPVVSSLLGFRARRDGSQTARMVDTYRTPEQKLMRWLEFTDGGIVVQDAAWFDLVADPTEHAPVGDLADPRLVAAWDALEAEYDRLRATWAATPRATAEQRRTQFHAMMGGDAAQQDLAALGYVDGRPPEDAVAPVGLAPPERIEIRGLERPRRIR